MKHDAAQILAIREGCADKSTFPTIENGYAYFAATRLSLFRSAADWAMVIEFFGFSPRSRDPDVHVQTFPSKLHERNPRSNYVIEDAYRNYLAANPSGTIRIWPTGSERATFSAFSSSLACSRRAMSRRTAQNVSRTRTGATGLRADGSECEACR